MTAPEWLSAQRLDLLKATTGYGDGCYDADRRLLWNPPGSLTPDVADRTVHQLPPSAWYAIGLFLRDGGGDRVRAVEIIDALCDLQYDEPGTEWHGTFSQFAESRAPQPGAVMWFDFDPNWRQFLGTAFVLVLRHWGDDLTPVTVGHMERALRLAVEGETDRVTASYSNIALMKAVLEVEAGTRLGEPAWVASGHELAEEIFARFRRVGGFDEYNSPTYYGVDLLALAMWRTCPVSERLRALGARLEADLWFDVARFFHPALRNLCGPYTRAYGMDMNRYVAGLALWMWAALGREAAPLPSFDTPVVPHGHDLLKGPVAALLGSPIDPELREALREVPLDRQIEQQLGRRRTITAWLGERVMIGAEDSTVSFANGQFCPATLHWLQPDGMVGTIRLVHDGPVSAHAERGRLTLRCDPHPVEGRRDPTFVIEPSADADTITASRWELPGLVVEVATSSPLEGVATVDEALRVTYRGGGGPVEIALEVVPRLGPGRGGP